jgi:HAE1 family hydrophobic/amphiphilic exporter-1
MTVSNGVPVRLRDLATVSDAIQEQRVFSRVNGEPSVQMTITAQPGANVVSLGTDLIAKIHEIERRHATIRFTTILDQREFILLALRALEHTAFYGAILAVLVILLFLHSWRATVIVALSLPVSILGALFAMYATGQSLNVMTLGGLALAVGLIVDDAVVVIENISRFLRKGLTPTEAAEGATTQILGAVIASTVTVVIVFLPLMMIPGQQQLIFSPLAVVIMSSVGVSLLVAVLTVPMLSAELLRRRLGSADVAAAHREQKVSFARRFETRYVQLEALYRRALGFCIDRPRMVFAVSGLLLIAALLIVYLGVVPTEIFPPSDSRFIEFNLQAPNGTAVNVMNEITRTVENAFLQDSRVEAVGSVIGQLGNGNNTRSLTNRSSIQIALQPGTSGPAAARFVSDWRARLNGPTAGQGVPDGAALRTTMIGTIARGQTVDIVQRQISQHQTALELEIFGPNVDRLQSIADGVMASISGIPGVGDPDKNVTVSQPEVNVMVDRTRLMLSGLGTGDLAQVLSTATNGTIASYYQINGIQYPIIVELPPSERRSFSSLQGLEFMPLSALSTPSRASMSGTLGNVATLTTTLGPSAISREDRQRRVEIDAPISGRPLGPILSDAARIMDRYPLPNGYRWEYGPEIERGETSFNSLWLAVGLAVILIYMLLAAQFESYVDPLVIITAVPLSTVGIVTALLITNRAFGLPAFVGTLMLVGICVKNSILVVEFTKQLREEGLDAREALLRAGPIRLRPILMTSMATIGGMLPLALGIEAGSSTQAPLATVVIGGLIASTFLSLLVVPTLYFWITRRFGGRFISRRRAPSTAKEFQSVLGATGEQTTTELQTGFPTLDA